MGRMHKRVIVMQPSSECPSGVYLDLSGLPLWMVWRWKWSRSAEFYRIPITKRMFKTLTITSLPRYRRKAKLVCLDEYLEKLWSLAVFYANTRAKTIHIEQTMIAINGALQAIYITEEIPPEEREEVYRKIWRYSIEVLSKYYRAYT